MSIKTNKQPIEVGILEISAQNRAILEFFFSDAGKSYFKEVSLDQASAFIIDYDSLGAKESWETTFEETKKPGIIISIKEVDLPSTIWLKKPLTVKALKEAGESIREMMVTAPPSPSTPAVSVIEEQIKTIEEEISVAAPGVTQTEMPQVIELPTEEITTIPSKPISQIEPENLIFDNVEDIDLSDKSKDVDQIEQVANIHESNVDDDFLSLVEDTTKTTQETALKVDEKMNQPEALEVGATHEEAKLEIAGNKASASSSSFAGASNFIDIDLSLDDSKTNVEKELQKSSTTPIERTVSANSKEESEIDSLLESLISGGNSNDPESAFAEGSSNSIDNNSQESDEALDFNLETVELETVEPEITEPVTEELSAIEDIQTDINTAEDNDISLLVDSEPSEIEVAIDEDINTITTDANAQAGQSNSAEEELQSLLEEIRQEAEESPEDTSKPSSQGSAQILNKYAPTNAEERWKLICGEPVADLGKIEFFNPSNHVLATFIQNIKLAIQHKTVTRIKFSGIIVVIDPDTDRIYCDQPISTDFYASLCYDPLPIEKIKVHTLDTSEIRLYRKKMKEEAEHTHYIEAFIWTSSLLTSRGRLPKNTKVKNKVGLTAWPNLTRVEKIPHMMQIAALFHKNNWSLLEITKKSGVPTNYVTAFYNAALTLDMIQTDGEVINATPLNTGDKKSKGFLSRFLKKLTT